MLVLKRRIGESILIGNDIEIQILGVDGDQVKIGFNAPKDIQILRKELYEEVVAENQAAKDQNNHLQQEQVLNLLKQFKM
ncbi:carbon storage regulator CsrA [Paenibacillus sp. ACRRY]|uniref:carbon storage regulator CsrA n=1 Tax=Paenibacillus sp. ACRRY TaxID=2918208 RepID=UPI001EF70513|nr:carbon storage regulator CsrA [Paenibacillus sp. ACRRY]MCG7384096.1 carbon storage regulator CsrA [Paenibacillus sp. ACRRY]